MGLETEDGGRELPTKESTLRPTGRKGRGDCPSPETGRTGALDISQQGSPAGGKHRAEWRQVKSSLGLADGKYLA